MGPDLALVRVSGADVGARVVVRHLLPDGRATDVLGELLGADAAGMRVRRERGKGGTGGVGGEVVTIAAAHVVAARVVPPRAVREQRAADSAVLELEEIAVAGWPPLERAWLGRWLLRASAGFTGRGNSAVLLGAADRPVAQAVGSVESYYRERSLVARVSVPTTPAGRPLQAAADAELARQGWVVDSPALVMTGALGSGGSLGSLARPPLPPGCALDLATEPDAAWLAAYRYRGAPLPPAGLAVLTGSPVRVFAAVRTEGDVLAVARGSVEAGWMGISAVEVVPPARRRGLARALLGALADWGAGQGAQRGYLQVSADNGPARALYASSGFVVHHGYHYRMRA